MEDTEKKLLKKKQQLLQKGNKLHLATICNSLAELYLREGKYEQSIEEYKNEARLYEETGRRIFYARSNRMIGEVYMSLAEFDKALEYETVHLNIAREEHNELEEQRALASIGRTYLTKGISDPDKSDLHSLNLAYDSFKQSLELTERLTGIKQLELLDMRARLLLNIGVVKENQNDFENGIKYMEKAIDICKKHDIYDQLHQCYSTLGSLYTKKNDFKVAISYFNLAIDVAERLSDKIPPLCASLLAKSEVLIKLADFQNAKQVLRKAYKLKTPNLEERQIIVHNLKVVIAMCNTEDTLLTSSATDYKLKKKLYEKMGDGACALKNYPKAIDYYNKMLEFAMENGEQGKCLQPVYISLAQTYKDNKQYSLALDCFRKEYEISKNTPEESYSTLVSIADVLVLAGRDYAEISEVYKRARKCSEAIGKVNVEGFILKKWVNVLRQFGKHSEATKLEKELTLLDYVESEKEDESEDTPDIGYDVNIDALSDLSDDELNEEAEQPATRKRGKRFNIKKNVKGETQLHIACISGNTTLVQSLLNQGHVVNVRDHCGWLPLHEASNHGHYEVVKLLLDHGAAINDHGGSLCDGVTPLHDAAANGHLKIIELLLDRGASPLVQTNSGETPLNSLKNWRMSAELDLSEAKLYEVIAARFTSALERTGRSIKSPLNESERRIETPERTVKRKSTPLKKSAESKIGSLRRSLDLSDPGPSTSRGFRAASFEKRNGRRSPSNDNLESNDLEMESASEYKRIIDNLRNKPLLLDAEPSSSTRGRKTPFLDGNDVGDDWLDDDLGRNKRRKTNSGTKNTLINTTGIRRTSSSNSTDLDSDIEIDSGRRKRNQPSLLDSGFSRESSVSRTQAVNCVSQITNKPIKWQRKITSFGSDDSSDFMITTPVDLNVTQSVSRSLLALNVRIDNKLWRIPVPMCEMEELTIGWLANEASKRYYKKEGISPNLQLETKEGAILVNEDPLSMLFSSTLIADEVQSTIVSWNLPPLPERYDETCVNSKTEINTTLRQHLDECQGTLNLNLEHFPLEPTQHLPLFRALNRQNNLQHLNLTGTMLLNNGVKHLCYALPSFTQLRTLNLSLNNLTSESIRYISETFQPAKPILENLNELNLNMNALADETWCYLNKILKHLKLRVLKLSGCNFTKNVFDNISNRDLDLNFEYLETFDISYNELNELSIIKFMSFLNFNILIDLNFGNNLNINENGITKQIALNLQKNNSLNMKSLNLSRCKVNDSEMLDLLRTLSNMRESNLETLNLSCNNDLTSISLRRLLQQEPCPFVNINLEDCNNLIQYLDYFDMVGVNVGRKLRCFSISLNCEQNNAFEILMSIWMNEWGERARVERMLDTILRFTIND